MSRHTLIFTTPVDITEGSEILIEIFADGELVVDECNLATRRHPGYTWSPPVVGDQTS